jgi:hypothetical protein
MRSLTPMSVLSSVHTNRNVQKAIPRSEEAIPLGEGEWRKMRRILQGKP